MKRIYEGDDGCLYIATSGEEAADFADSIADSMIAWTDEQMSAQVMSEESRATHGIDTQTWQEWVDVEQVGFLLDPNEPYDEVDA